MLRYLDAGGRALMRPDEPGAIPDSAVWVDLLDPDSEELATAAEFVGVDLPTRADMEEIEASSRTYREGEARIMTATLVSAAGREMPQDGPVSFVLNANRLVTVRYHEPRPFDSYLARLGRRTDEPCSGADVLTGLLETIIDRSADILEEAGAGLETISQELFTSRATKKSAQVTEVYDDLLTRIGLIANRVGKVQQSLLSLNRVLGFARLQDDATIENERLDIVREDLKSLIEQEGYLNNKVAFLLDATLGFISSAQNSIINLFSVIAVIFLPPTLVASIYGMNFEIMPELDWTFGYPYALALMAVVAIGPFLFFKRMNWL